jgi:hypothetical protein
MMRSVKAVVSWDRRWGASRRMRASVDERVGAEVHVQVVVVGQGEEDFTNVFVDRKQIRQAFGGEDALVLVASADDDNGVDANSRI